MNIPESIADKVYVAGAALKDDVLVTNGGRVLGATAVEATLTEAIETAYGYVRNISFENAYYRNDIGAKALLAKTEVK